MGSDAQLIVRICRAVRTGIEWNFSECENALIFGESDYSRAARPTRPDLRGCRDFHWQGLRTCSMTGVRVSWIKGVRNYGNMVWPGRLDGRGP